MKLKIIPRAYSIICSGEDLDLHEKYHSSGEIVWEQQGRGWNGDKITPSHSGLGSAIVLG